MQETLTTSQMCPDQDQTHNLEMCPDGESNLWHFGLRTTLQPIELHWLGLLLFYFD